MEKTYICAQTVGEQSMCLLTQELKGCQHPHCVYLIQKIQALYMSKAISFQDRNQTFSLQNPVYTQINARQIFKGDNTINYERQLMNLQKKYQNLVKNMTLLQVQHQKTMDQNCQLRKINVELVRKTQLQKQVNLLVEAKQKTNKNNERPDLNYNIHSSYQQQTLQHSNFENHANLTQKLKNQQIQGEQLLSGIASINATKSQGRAVYIAASTTVLKEHNKNESLKHDQQNQLRKLKGYLNSRKQIQNPRHKQIVKLKKLLQGF